MHLYSALLCIVVHQRRFTFMWAGTLLNHHQCAASTWMMRRLPQDNGTSALTTNQLQVERRESHRANQVYALTTHQLQVERRESQRAIKCMRSPHTSYRWRGERVKEQSSGWGLLRGHDWHGPVVKFFPWHRGYTATFYEKCHGIFNDHRESGPRFKVSSKRRHKDPHRPQGEHSLLVSLTPLP